MWWVCGCGCGCCLRQLLEERYDVVGVVEKIACVRARPPHRHREVVVLFQIKHIQASVLRRPPSAARRFLVGVGVRPRWRSLPLGRLARLASRKGQVIGWKLWLEKCVHILVLSNIAIIWNTTTSVSNCRPSGRVVEAYLPEEMADAHHEVYRSRDGFTVYDLSQYTINGCSL